MKKIILGLICVLHVSTAQELTYSDLYGEIQMNMVAANTCLKEVSYTKNTNGKNCTQYWNLVGENSQVYQSILGRKFSDLDTKDTFWTETDWIILKNQMKKLIYVTELIKQFK